MSQKWKKEEEGEQERRERFVFMLVVTGVFLAPPTQGDRKGETGEGGCDVQGEKESKKIEVFKKG